MFISFLKVHGNIFSLSERGEKLRKKCTGNSVGLASLDILLEIHENLKFQICAHSI